MLAVDPLDFLELAAIDEEGVEPPPKPSTGIFIPVSVGAASNLAVTVVPAL